VDELLTLGKRSTTVWTKGDSPFGPVPHVQICVCERKLNSSRDYTSRSVTKVTRSLVGSR
jgi:hypothetical protein